MSRRAALEEALRQQEAAAAAYESAMCTTQQALTDYGAAYIESDSFDRDSGNHRLQFVKEDGTFLKSIGNGKGGGNNQFHIPSGCPMFIARLPSGALVVSDYGNKRFSVTQ